MKLYKRKIFYVPLLLFLLSIIIAGVLLYKPMKLIYWAAVDFPMERAKLAKLFNDVKGNKESLNEFFKNYQPHTKEFEALLDFSKTAKRDFMVARYLGLEGDYFDAYVKTMHINEYFTGFAGYISLGLKHLLHPNGEHIQFLSFIQSKIPSYLQNTQEFIGYLAKHKYFDNDAYKMINAMRIGLVLQFFTSFNNNEFCLLKEKDILFQQIQEDYQILQNLTDEKVIQGISLNFGGYDKMLKKHNGFIAQARELLDECR